MMVHVGKSLFLDYHNEKEIQEELAEKNITISRSEIVLDNVKLPTEKAEKIIPFLKRIKISFGKPLALVHDMGKGILSAVKEVLDDVPDFICHFHFLRDLGKDLFGKENDQIRNRLRFHGMQGRADTLTSVIIIPIPGYNAKWKLYGSRVKKYPLNK